jgi:anti-sigma regulatory factor (Ser/Thr protein kinase)
MDNRAKALKIRAYTRPVCDGDVDGFHHEALLYADADEFLAGTVPFIRSGLEADEAILIALPRSNLELLESELNGEGERVEFAEMEELGRNPARIIPAWRDFLDWNDRYDCGLRGIGEPIWPGRSAVEVDECGRHESLLNLAFAGGRPWSLLCPYDAARLDDSILEGAEHNHPVVSDGSGARTSDRYAEPDPRQLLSGELAPPAPGAAEMLFTIRRLGEVRHFVGEQAGSLGLDPSRVDDLVLAANELATNSLRHGRGGGAVRIWREGESVSCEVDDQGRIDYPLVGRERPHPDQPSGRGLWLANQLCDLVQIRSGDAGSTVRLQMTLGHEGLSRPDRPPPAL